MFLGRTEKGKRKKYRQNYSSPKVKGCSDSKSLIKTRSLMLRTRGESNQLASLADHHRHCFIHSLLHSLYQTVQYSSPFIFSVFLLL
jgi:hypothetical protein